MKKVISVLLLLAICIGCFAGCAPKEDAGLNSAKEYLYAMYKDAEAVTSNDYTVVSQVRINDVVYPITWTADKADNVQIVAGDNNMTTVKITASTEDVNYKLTATMKNADGLEVSVSFDHIIPAKAQIGGTVVLAFPKENKYITGSHYLYEAKNKWELNLSENKADAIALEVIENSDDTVTLKAGNYYLFCDATSVKFASEQSDNTKFVLEAADTEGGYFIKCAVANYGGKAQYLEVYSGYLTCYGMGSDTSIYIFKLEEGTGANGTISGLDAAPAPDNTPSTSNPPATNPPATNPPATNPPATNPPATNPPATNPPATNPPATNPPAVTTSWTKVSSLNDGDKIVIVNPASNMALSMTKTGFYNNGVDVSSNFNSITDEEIFVVKKNSDGSVTLTSVSGKKVALADSYSSLNEEGANDKWTISDAGDGQSYLKNVGRDIYLEWYASKNNWSAYNPGEDKLNADYVLAFYKQA